MNKFQKDFSKGYSCAVANLIRDHGDGTEAEDCYKANFLSIKELKEIDADIYDIETLTPMIKEIERRNRGYEK